MGLPYLNAQESTMYWRDGVLYSEMPGGGMVVLGSITGTVERKEIDGTITTQIVRQVPANFRLTPNQNDSPEVIELRKHFNLVTRSIVDSQKTAASRRVVSAGARDDTLSNDGLIFLVYNLESARSILDLTERQFEQIETLAKNYKQEVEAIRPKSNKSSDAWQQENATFMNKVIELRTPLIAEISGSVLLPHQIRPANLQSPEFAGMVRILGRTGIGDEATLNAEQKDRICVGATQIAVRLQDQIAQARRDIRKLLEAELKDAQIDRIEEFYPGMMSRQFEGTSIEQLLRTITVPSTRDVPPPASPEK